MPRTTAKAADSKPTEPEKPPEIAESVRREQVHHDENKDLMEEEEVEYEEVEEEVEVEEEEEAEEEEAAQEENVAADGKGHAGDDNMKDAHEGEDEDDSDEQAELLALPHGSEVFIGGISKASEEDVKRFCQSVGKSPRLMTNMYSSEKKAYAFVTFRTKELATKAVEELNNNELKGRKVKCSTSHAKNKLFIGNVPCRWSEGDMRRAVEKVGPGVIKVNLKEVRNSSYNCGFAFVEYYNHACAEYSRKKMSTPEFKLDSNAPIVGWAEPKCGVLGQVLDCSIARPSAEKKDKAVDNYKGVGLLPLPSYSPFGYGVMPGAYGAIPVAYPVICGRRTPGLMVPSMLPDGQLVRGEDIGPTEYSGKIVCFPIPSLLCPLKHVQPDEDM
uniref:RRM domain-containing protein n=1 Tax=Ananas comosus var. bracteatus TaxID=296719 RepID=A0A6V7QRN5_ANACO